MFLWYKIRKVQILLQFPWQQPLFLEATNITNFLYFLPSQIIKGSKVFEYSKEIIRVKDPIVY